jgi:hypothetical protein
MNHVIKFPDMRPPKSRGAPASELPAPAQYRQSSPAIITADLGITTQPVGRKRLVLWFGLAAALHAALFLVIWLTPPLRLKWSPSPDAWVQVVSLPRKASEAPVVEPVKVEKPIPSKAKVHKAQPVVESNQERSK